MVTKVASSAWTAAASVVDPELRVVTIEDLGILRDVILRDVILRDVGDRAGRVTVTITPTYSGCPAMDVIRADILRALATAGYADAEVVTVLAPAWSTDDITEEGRAKLAAAGIAPPSGVDTAGSVAVGPVAKGPVPVAFSVRCPRCGSPDTVEISRFGSTACKALWRCHSCQEPFDRVKPL